MKKTILIICAFMISLVALQAQIKVKNNDALIILNGNESSVAELEKLDPTRIESIEVMKGKEAKKIYGKKGEDGALVVQLKWNREDKDLATLFEAGPIFIVSGIQVSRYALGEIDPNNIESINVLKGESAIAKYGEKGENGVVIINLKSNNKFKSFLPFDND